MQLNSLGSRLVTERKRLGLNQTDFADKGGVKKGSQINYEKDQRNPDSNYLAGIAAAGADISFIITGQSAPEDEPRPSGESPNAVLNVDLLLQCLQLLEEALSEAGATLEPRGQRVWTEGMYHVGMDEVSGNEVDFISLVRHMARVTARMHKKNPEG